MRFSNRLEKIGPYPFVAMEERLEEKRKRGEDIISFGIGDPDLPTPQIVIDALVRGAKEVGYHKYSTSTGESFFRESVARWFKRRFDVDLDPDKNVVCLIGSKEGIANIARGFVNPGDSVLLPELAYPVYANGAALLCDASVSYFPLEDTTFLPSLDEINVRPKTKLMFMNYPNNPTGATCELEVLEEVARFCRDNDILLCYDNAYSEITYGEYRAPSILQAEDALENCVEFHSCSKTFNMTGDRIGFAVGCEMAIDAVKKVKQQIDSGAPPYVQYAGAVALDSYKGSRPPDFVEEKNGIFYERFKVLVKGLNSLGFDAEIPRGSFYLWLKVDGGERFAEDLFERNVIVTPGSSFGPAGENYVRFALTVPKHKIEEAIRRIEEM
ncbi:MAG: aminotransferase class I/II-fold pyridoxal phosphate-dependent enzyme [Thermoplasmata archaeon]